jgi:PUA domain protein
MPIKRRFYLRKSSLKQLKREVAGEFGSGTCELLGRAIEIVELENGREVLLAGGKPLLFRTPEGFFPTLHSIDQIGLRRVTINMGAVPHVAGGADVMAPGVTRADEIIALNEKVVVVDERHGKPLAIGIALVKGADMKAPKGRVVKNVHHVGDEIWRLGERFPITGEI